MHIGVPRRNWKRDSSSSSSWRGSRQTQSTYHIHGTKKGLDFFRPNLNLRIIHRMTNLRENMFIFPHYLNIIIFLIFIISARTWRIGMLKRLNEGNLRQVRVRDSSGRSQWIFTCNKIAFCFFFFYFPFDWENSQTELHKDERENLYIRFHIKIVG